MNNIYYIYGSESSSDLNVLVEVSDVAYMSSEELNSLCKNFEDKLMDMYPNKDIDVNLITIKNGIVVWCFSGILDEVNNCLIDTYSLHNQKYNLLINRRLYRDFELKSVNFIDSTLKLLSETSLKELIKDSLNGSIYHKLKILSILDLSQITDLNNKNIEFKEYLKIVSFHIGQILGLILNQELYTKESIVQEFPRLKPFLFKEANYDLSVIEYYKTLVVKILSTRKWKKF